MSGSPLLLFAAESHGPQLALGVLLPMSVLLRLLLT